MKQFVQDLELESKQKSIEWRQTIFPKRRNLRQCLREEYGYWILGVKKELFVWQLCLGDNRVLWAVHWNSKKSGVSPSSSSSNKKHFRSVAPQRHDAKHRRAYDSGRHRIRTGSVSTCILQSLPHTIKFSSLWYFKRHAEEKNYVYVTRCRGFLQKLHTENNFTGLEYMLLFQSGRTVLKQLENILQNKYELSNVVVKLREIFLYINDKKTDEMTFWRTQVRED